MYYRVNIDTTVENGTGGRTSYEASLYKNQSKSSGERGEVTQKDILKARS